MASRFYLLFLFTLFFQCSYSLFAISGSPCYSACKGDTPPSSDDIVCTDSNYTNSDPGKTLQSCMGCLETSSYAQDNKSDSFLFFYYLMLVQQKCLTEPDSTPLSYCSSKCDSIGQALSFPLDQSWFQHPYDFCSQNSNRYTTNAPNCGTCLQAQEGSVIVGNFVVVGNVACGSTPALWNGQNVSFDGNLFDSSTLDASAVGTNTPITPTSSTTKTGKPTVSGLASSTSSVSSTPTSTSSQGRTSSNPAAPTAHSDNRDSDNGAPGISRGAAAGIGIIVGIAGVAGVIGLAVFARKKRGVEIKRRSALPTSVKQPEGGRPIIEKPLPAVRPFPKHWTVKGMTPRTSAWYFAANPKSSTDLSALPQRDWR